MRFLVLTAALACVLLARAPALADSPSGPLTLRGAVRYALARDPTVLAKRATLAQNESTFAQNHATEFPAISGMLQNQMSKNNGNTAGTFQQFGLQQAQVFSQNTAQIGANYTLYNGSLNQINAQQARRQAEAARADERRSEQLLARDVANAWYLMLQRRQAVRLAQGDLAYQRQLLETARLQERRGRVAGVDVLRAQTNELRSEAALVSAQSDDANARETFAQRIGAPFDTPFAIPDELPEPPLPATPLEMLVAEAIAARPDIGYAQAEIEVAQLADSAIETNRRPTVQLTGAFGNQETPATSFFSQGVGFGLRRNVPGFWSLGATSTFSLPLIEYGARRAEHAAARAQIASAQGALANERALVELDVRQALRAAQTTSANVAFAREETRYGTESARIAELQYRNGLISFSDATAAAQTALSAATDLVNARVNYLDALVGLRLAVGVYDPLTIADPGGP